MKIYGHSFYESSINPYFDYNLFDNWDKNVSFFYWNISNIYYRTGNSLDSLLNNNVDIIIATPLYDKIDIDSLKEYYNAYEFRGATYFENKIYEDMSCYVFVRKDIDIS